MTRYIVIGLMVLSCLTVQGQTRTGDNLGTHKAEKDLNMNDKKIVSVSGMVIGNATMINNTSVALELAGTDKAFLFNRVASLSAIVAPVDGMAVYNNGDQRFYIRQNGVWETLAAIGDLLWSKIVGKPTFAAVALSGDYNDLINKPSIPTLLSQLTNDVGFITTTSLTWSNITGKPSFHAVATSGNYNDLINRPTIPTALSQLTNDPGFITASSLTWDNITNKPNLHAVATSGNYNVLNNKPTIPTALSQLTNDPGYITSSSLTWSNISGKPSFHAVATSGNYNDLSNRPTIPTALSQLSNDPGYITGASLTWNNISGKPSFHTVATTGNYNDLTNRPTIPTVLSQLSNDVGYNKWYDGWVNYPGYDANTIGASKSGFSYSNNAPYTGPLAHFDAGGYGLQLSAAYSGGNYIGFRTRNGDAGSWNGWREFIHSGNISSQSVNYANSAGGVSWGNVSGRPVSLSQFSNDLGNYGGWITTNGRAYPRRSDGADMNFYWSGQSGQPTWLWGSNDGINHYVWNPSNFSVNYANSANTANSATNATNATNATYGRYVYDNGAYSGAAAWREASSMHVYYAYLGRLVYNNGAYSGSGWVEPSDMGVRYANNSGALGGFGASDYLGKEGNTYYQQRTWIAVNGDYGTYYPGATGFSSTPHFYPTNSTYGVFRIDGYRNGYTGFYMGYAGVNTGMYDGSGNGGEYNASYGWYTYFNRGNGCMGINGSGTSSSYAMYLNGKGLYAAGSSAIAGQLDVSGDVVGFSSLPSDIRLKKNMKRITGASDIVRKLGGYYFDWKKDGKHDIGVKAQEVEIVIPEIVSETKLPFQSPLGDSDTTKYKIVQYEKLVAVLIEAQKEQMDLVDQLRSQNEANEKLIETLLKRVTNLEKNTKSQPGRKIIPLSKK